MSQQLNLGVFSFLFLWGSLLSAQESPKDSKRIQWISFNELETTYKKEPRPVLIYVHASWCGYCIKLEAKTFKQPKIFAKINQKFYALKLDLEKKEDLLFFNHSYTGPSVKGEYHQLAEKITNSANGLAVPSFLFVDLNKKGYLAHGYMDSKEFFPLLEKIEAIKKK